MFISCVVKQKKEIKVEEGGEQANARAGGMAEKAFTLDAPQYDQSTWAGRTKHFFTVTNPVFLFTRHVPRARARKLFPLRGRLSGWR